MNKDACFHFGRIIKAHGIKGEVLINLAVEDPSNFKKLESVFVELNQKLVPFFIEKITYTSPTKCIIAFEDVGSLEDVEDLLNADIYLPLTSLPSLKKGQFYYHEVQGYLIEDKSLGELGTIVAIVETAGHDLICMDYKGTEVLIPLTDNIVLSADHDRKKVFVDLPDGLVEMYTGGDDQEEGEEEE
ncbi:MAG TPA: ribosome maturation factor RimM [Cytophagaceae bacterium]|jgi:16S rRNA processing protein RimM